MIFFPTAHNRPEIRYAWWGPPELLVDNRGRAGTEPLSGFFFRETRYLHTHRLEIDGDEPAEWRDAAADSPHLRAGASRVGERADAFGEGTLAAVYEG